uniref:Gamma-soluble NSF attachment protein n=1 Tax=Timema poppense TaxID=170557 RepID=A0A7R9D013_TIMPO|nr:unnamed protein product [Timema poppensis]
MGQYDQLNIVGKGNIRCTHPRVAVTAQRNKRLPTLICGLRSVGIGITRYDHQYRCVVESEKEKSLLIHWYQQRMTSGSTPLHRETTFHSIIIDTSPTPSHISTLNPTILKTSLLKWRPDFEEAADEYSKAGPGVVVSAITECFLFQPPVLETYRAWCSCVSHHRVFLVSATCFRNGKSLEQCRECLMKAAECNKQKRSSTQGQSLYPPSRPHKLEHRVPVLEGNSLAQDTWFESLEVSAEPLFRCIDQAVLVCKDLGDLRAIADLAERSCSLYQQHGSPDSGAAALDKAAKILEKDHPELALRLYQKAADVVIIEDSPRQAAEFMSKVARLMVKLQMYDQAADVLRREMGLHQESDNIPAMGRLTVAMVLVQLARGDYVGAEKAFKEWGNCCDAPEVQTLETLLQAYDEEDADTARTALNNPFIKYMDVEYARLARDLPLPQGIASISKPTEAKKPDSGELGGDQDDDDDEFAGGLC